MKKNLIYTVTFLLCGSFLFGSCQDMLNVDSDRVEYEFEGWTPSDSVYSVLGILKAVQGIADRHILLNELRADLTTISRTKAIAEVQEIYNSDFSNLETNKFLDVKDYYTVINNCNIFLNRVDTTLSKNGVRYMMPEYVAVKSMRAWTYMQLAINHNEIPFFTEPITKHSVAEEMMRRPKLSRDEVFSKLIADLAPYESPIAYPMPVWDNEGSNIFSIESGETNEYKTSQLFVPVRMLLGEMYLWRGDYKNAAKCFHGQITGTASIHNSVPNFAGTTYADNANTIKRISENDRGTTSISDNYSALFGVEAIKNKSSLLTLVPFAKNEKLGTTSELANIFAPPGDVGGAQVVASPGIVSLAALQMYCNDVEKPEPEYGDVYEYPGDLRIKATTFSQIADDQMQTKYSNIISKFNLESKRFGLGKDLEASYIPTFSTLYIMLQRAELAYLRFAEALVGLDSEGYDGAMEIAMTTLKDGLKAKYTMLQNPVYADSVRLDAEGKPMTKLEIDEEGNQIEVEIRDTYLKSCSDSLTFNFALSELENNTGIHSRGSGDSEKNAYYDLKALCIARYLGSVEEDADGVQTPTREIVYQDSLNYMRDLILDELALELSWEGYRFGDLVRFAKTMNDNDVLAKRVAGREKNNDVTYRNTAFETDGELYNKMYNETNWYIPLPDTVTE